MITPVVTLKNIAFHPAHLVVKKGTTVTWRFRDPYVTHNVTSRGKSHLLHSPDKEKGTYSVTFKRTGTYRYECTLHPNMEGDVTVR